MAANPDATPKQALLMELAELTHIALAPDATENDRAVVRGMLDKLDKKSRRRRGGRKKPKTETAGAERGDDDEDLGPDYIGF